jgi:hypothetical protein
VDEELDRRRRNGEPPFDGLTVTVEHLLPLPCLRQALISVVRRLRQEWPRSNLYSLHDWHEHDGWISPAKPSSWQEVEALLASEDALRRSAPGDTYVRLAFFPEGREFYLRWYVPADYDQDSLSDWTGHFDLTCRPELARELAALVGAGGVSDVRLGAASEHFCE